MCAAWNFAVKAADLESLPSTQPCWLDPFDWFTDCERLAARDMARRLNEITATSKRHRLTTSVASIGTSSRRRGAEDIVAGQCRRHLRDEKAGANEGLGELPPFSKPFRVMPSAGRWRELALSGAATPDFVPSAD
jgi:hypothetical protein